MYIEPEDALREQISLSQAGINQFFIQDDRLARQGF
jgi:hypothetical protein